MVVLEHALRYAAGGLSVIPVLADGSKAPAVTKWEPHQRRRASEAEIRAWFDGSRELGIAIVCGAVSGNLLVMDFDMPGYYDEWREAVDATEPGILEDLPIVRTPKGYGRHVYVRTTNPKPGAKLARAPAANGRAPWAVAVETRGEGQYVLAPGCPPACHAAGTGYEHLSGPFPEEAPVLADEAVEILLRSAKALNRFIEARGVVGEAQRAGERVNRPGDDYCRRGEWTTLLERHGWELVRTRGEESYWRRPDKDGKGISASLGHCRSDASGALLYVFSSNAAPFEADRAYNLFGAFVMLEHGGDFHAGAVRLAADGFGQSPPGETLDEVRGVIERIRAKIMVVGDGVALLPRKRVDAPLKSDPKFKRTWTRARPELRLEQTRYDTSLLWYARKLSFTLEEMVSLVYDHRIEHQCNPEQALDPVYMAKKIAWVFSAGESEDDTLARAEAQQVIDGGDDNIVREIRARTAIRDFVRVVQRGEDEEMYCIELEGGRVVEIGRVQVFREQQKKFIGQIYKRLRANMEELKGYEWKALHDLFLQCLVVERNIEEEPEIVGNEVVERYLATNQVHVVTSDEDRLDALKRREPFVEAGTISLHFGHFWDWVMTVRPRERGWGYHRLRSILRELRFQDQKIAGPYPRVYHSRPVDDFPSREIMERIAQSTPLRKVDADDRKGGLNGDRGSTYE